jgi:hypothetical protein
MKSLHSKLSGIAPFILFPALIIFHKRKNTFYVLIFLMAISLSGCFRNFYSTNTKHSVDTAALTRLKSENKYFIVHFPRSTYGLEQAYVDGDTLHGNLVTLAAGHLKYLHPESADKNTFKKTDKNNALMEVHLYTNVNNTPGSSMLSASLSSFNRADIYEFNKSASQTNHILSTVGILLTAGLIAGVIVALASAASSGLGAIANCPQVYVDNAGKYYFTSGLYSGAVCSTLERTDYLPLASISANARDIYFKIANAKNEEQFINSVQLMQVIHLPGVNVLPDRHGNIFSYNSPISPVSASTGGKNDIKNVLLKTDESYYSFSNSLNEDGLSDVVLTFAKPQNTDKAKLVIHGRNTYWGGLLHKEVISLFGDNFEKWREKQEKADPKKLERWQTDQALPLMVYLKTSKGWKFIDYFPLIGNTSTRDMIMEINTKATTQETIELRLETAYRFWDLDFAGIDYSANSNFTTSIIEPDNAIASDNTDQKALLSSSDNQYAHLTGYGSIYFKYTIAVSAENNISSYFLVSGGYYHNLERITGKTNYRELYKFQKKGAFDKFSREKYRQAQDVVQAIKGINK